MYITNQNQLDEFIEHLAKQEVIAIDTEFQREKTYYPILSLIQIATLNTSAVIDILCNLDLKQISTILLDKKITKVFHACSQDIEVLYHHFKIVPNNIFDTQIAAQFINYQQPPSYDKLVLDYADVHISKKFQYSDWIKRPLSTNQLKYALNDVAYLLTIKDKQTEAIKFKGHLEWLEEENQELSNYHYYEAEVINQLGKFTSSFENTKAICMIYIILNLREIQAKKLNKHRNLVLRDDLITSAVKNNSIDNNICHKLDIKDPNEIVVSANEPDTINRVKQFIKKSYKPKTDKILYQKFKDLLQIKSNELRIASSLIANRNDLTLLADNNISKSKVLKGWRNTAFGQDALKVFNE